MQTPEKYVRYNIFANVTDAAFFGFGMGVSSFVTMIPLFIASLTDSTILIGLVASLHMVGWQLPQIFMSSMVARRKRYLPMVLWTTIHERWPFIALGFLCIALAGGVLGKAAALPLAFIFVLCHAFGGGITANAWQTMIGKIIPTRIRGTFYGIQSSAAALMGSAGALLAGFLLATLPYPLNFAVCFFLTGIAMMVSLGFLAISHEDAHVIEAAEQPKGRAFWAHLRDIFMRDANFRWFIVARSLSQLAQMVAAFYTIYAVRDFGLSLGTAGVLAGIQGLTQAIANPLVGRLGDIYGHRRTFALTNVLLAVSAFAAFSAQSPAWFYVIFALAGMVNAQWTTSLAMLVEFGTEVERPYYIGLANTAIAPATLLAPIIGGAIVDVFGFKTMFFVAIVIALICVWVTMVLLNDPHKRKPVSWSSAASAVAGD